MNDDEELIDRLVQIFLSGTPTWGLIEKDTINVLEMLEKRVKDRLAVKGTKPKKYPDIKHYEEPTKAHVSLQTFIWEHRLRNQGKALSPDHIIMEKFPPCLLRMDELKEIKIKDMLLDTHHTGKYVHLKTLSDASPGTWVQALAKDDAGDVVMMRIHNKWDRKGDVNDFLPYGTDVWIKQPYFSTAFTAYNGKEQLLTVHSEHPSDVRIHVNILYAQFKSGFKMKPEDIYEPSFFKDFGNTLFKQKYFPAAILWYVVPSELESSAGLWIVFPHLKPCWRLNFHSYRFLEVC